MTTDEQLTQRLTAAAELAPDPAGLAAGAGRGARTLRRRRAAVAVVAGAAVVVAVVTAASGTVGDGDRPRSQVLTPAEGPASACDVESVRREALAYLAVIQAVLKGQAGFGHLYVATPLVSGPGDNGADHAEGTMSPQVQQCLAAEATALPPITFVVGLDDPLVPKTGEGSIPTVVDGTLITLSAVPPSGSEIVVSASQNTGGGFGYSGGRYRLHITDQQARVVQELSTWIS
jgi:hypothetical protein